MSFTYTRTVHFQDTDAAGVVYFANVLAMCHEAYEASLATSGISLKSFFNNPTVAIPIVHASVDFLRPLFCGDQLLIQVMPKSITDSKFEIDYQHFVATAREQLVAKAITKHVCIDPVNRTKTLLSPEMRQWFQQFAC